MPSERETPTAAAGVTGQGIQVGDHGVQHNFLASEVARPRLSPQWLSALSPHAAGDRIRQLPYDDVVDLFAAASPEEAAEVIEVLLETDEALVVAVLADLSPHRAAELIGSLRNAVPWLSSLPEAAGGIARLALDMRWENSAISNLQHVSDAVGRHGFVQEYQNGPIFWYWDFGAVPGVATAAVTVYLSRETDHARVVAAVEDALATAGLHIEQRDEPVLGSWFQRMRAVAKQAVSSPGGREAIETAAHGLDMRLILAQDAQVTATLMLNVPALLQSLDHTKDAVLRIGALLIVKIDWTVQVIQLTPAQQFKLNHQPQLSSSPHEIVRALGLSIKTDPAPGAPEIQHELAEALQEPLEPGASAVT
jgi:hypothetical protein